MADKDNQISKISKHEISGEINIPVKDIRIPKQQARKSGGEENIDELMDSIERNGLLQAIVVYKADKLFYVIAGQRRLAACKELGMKTIPGRVLKSKPTELESLVISASENLVREDMINNDIKILCDYIAEKVGTNVGSIANLTGLPERIIRKYLKHLDLNKELQKLRELPKEHDDYISADLASRTQNTVLLSLPKEDKSFGKECLAWLEELKKLTPNAKDAVTKIVKSNPGIGRGTAIKKAKAPSKTKKITFTLSKTYSDKLSEYQEQQGIGSQDDAAHEIITERLVRLVPDEEDE